MNEDGSGENNAGNSLTCTEFQTCMAGGDGETNHDGKDAVCSGSTCANEDGEPLKSGLVCRNASDSCDLAETCNGNSINCPANAFKADAECTANLTVSLRMMTERFHMQKAVTSMMFMESATSI